MGKMCLLFTNFNLPHICNSDDALPNLLHFIYAINCCLLLKKTQIHCINALIKQENCFFIMWMFYRKILYSIIIWFDDLKQNLSHAQVCLLIFVSELIWPDLDFPSQNVFENKRISIFFFVICKLLLVVVDVLCTGRNFIRLIIYLFWKKNSLWNYQLYVLR